MMILDKINLPADLKKLNKDEMSKLPAEIRKFLIENISKTGGHLASNLGVVELTLALHNVFDLPNDNIVWDVGHQSYIHKILTGRREKFDTLRKFGGISGFPKPNESEYDSFVSGHSSTSISAALGMAMANKMHNAVAIIGDGALTGGMAFEALNHAGSQKDIPLIIVLNDNGMSIAKNVGGVAKRLNKIRINPRYRNIKADVKSVLDKIPLIGKLLKLLIQNIKMVIKRMVVGNSLFKSFGLAYLGPVDGHNVKKLCKVFCKAKRFSKPVLVHVLTTKGKGYKFAEENPNKFHGIGKFDPETGKIIGNLKENIGFSEAFGKSLCNIAGQNEKVVAITAAMPDGTGLFEFAKKFPKRFFDVGIAEQHAVTFAAGLAANGKIPVVAVYSTFLQRAYDQILHDTAISNQHVIFAVDRAGCVGADGETHQGIYTLSYLLHIPNMTVLAPSNTDELTEMLDLAVNKMNSPVAILYPRECRGAHSRPPVLQENADILIISLGTMLQTALDTAEILQSQGIFAGVINARFAKPLDLELLKKHAEGKKIVATIEDNCEIGGFGSYVESQLGQNVVKFAFPDKFIEQGEVSEIFEKYDLTAEQIAEKLVAIYDK